MLGLAALAAVATVALISTTRKITGNNGEKNRAINMNRNRTINMNRAINMKKNKFSEMLKKDELDFILSQEYFSTPNLPFPKPFCIVSLTTSPLRLKYLPWIFKTLDMKLVDEIHLNLPQLFKNKEPYNKDEIEQLQEWFPKLRVYRFEKDLGPISKILPTLERQISNSSAVILSIDDDMAYPKEFISNCLHYFNNHKDVDVVVHATYPPWILGKKYPLHSARENKRMVETFGEDYLMVEGFQGVAYRYMNVRDCCNDLRHFSQKNNLCFKNDDVVISAVLHRNKKRIEYRTHSVKNQMLSFGFGTDALHKNLEHHEVYYQVLQMVK